MLAGADRDTSASKEGVLEMMFSRGLCSRSRHHSQCSLHSAPWRCALQRGRMEGDPGSNPAVREGNQAPEREAGAGAKVRQRRPGGCVGGAASPGRE